MFYAENTDKNH